MGAISLIILFILSFIGIPVGIGCLLYFIPKKYGYPKLGKYLTITFGAILLILVLYIRYEDHFFTKNMAKELVDEQDIFLADEFELERNESLGTIGEFYHTFTLKISENDKQNAILKIRSADNFNESNESIDTLMFQSAPKRYFGEKVVQNYVTEKAFVREYFEPSGRENYAPTFRRISINKTGNELVFEDIDE